MGLWMGDSQVASLVVQNAEVQSRAPGKMCRGQRRQMHMGAVTLGESSPAETGHGQKH